MTKLGTGFLPVPVAITSLSVSGMFEYIHTSFTAYLSGRLWLGNKVRGDLSDLQSHRQAT